MNVRRILGVGVAVLALFAVAHFGHAASSAEARDWSMNATIIEACSCPMFCQCYFNTEPAAPAAHGGHGGHGGHGHDGGGHFCLFNNAFKVNHGSYGKVKLDGAKFWVAGDLGGDFTTGKMDWAILTFDAAVTPEQREGIQTALGALYPVQWGSFTVAPDAAMTWNATKDRADANLDGGKTAVVALKRQPGMTDDPIVIHNLVYWGAPRNDGFVLMPNEVEAYRAGDRAFEFKGTNGFMITLDINSKDAAKAK